MNPMLSELTEWGAKLNDGARAAREALRSSHVLREAGKKARRIAFAGMGGSGIAGRILDDIVSRRSDQSFTIIDGPFLPSVREREGMLLCISSYSGSTWEMLDLFEQARAVSLPVLVMTHGGELGRRAHEAGVPVITVPQSQTPRSALGLFIGILSELVSAWEIYPGQDLLAAIDKHWNTVGGAYASPHMYSDLLEYVGTEKTVGIWGVSRDTAAVAYRAQTQFNENSKMSAATALFPELNHNLLVGAAASRFKAFLFVTPFISPSLKASLESLESVCAARSHGLYKPTLFGDTWEECIFSALWWADYASCVIGLARGESLSETIVIDELKQMFAKRVSPL